MIRVAITLADEAGKIDLNQAPAPNCSPASSSRSGRPKETAFLLACRIVERRGGQPPDCPAPPASAPLHPAIFAAPEELAQLPGFDDRLYQQVADDVTVASGANAVDPMVAPRAVLLALPGATPRTGRRLAQGAQDGGGDGARRKPLRSAARPAVS